MLASLEELSWVIKIIPWKALKHILLFCDIFFQKYLSNEGCFIIGSNKKQDASPSI